MTRYTNVGWKRTYFQATFPNDIQIPGNTASTSAQGSLHDAAASSHDPYGSSNDTPAEPNSKRRRKSKSSSEPNAAAESIISTVASDGEKTSPSGIRSERTKVPARKLKPKAKEKARRAKTAADRAALTEARRLKRMAGRSAQMTCFACREVGHSAKDCPSIQLDTDRNRSTTTKTKANAKATAGVVVGICYRCGSRKHNLARCRRPTQPDNPLPYASCFVCSGQGHLAGSCPRNNGKGVYPNGGSCKLCGETTHLARDCALRKTESSAVATLLGTGHEGGADEDDFHTIRRKNAEVDRDEHGEERARKEAKVRAGAFTGIVKAFGKAPEKPKKVVYF